METVGITALVPPELIYACGKRPCDINNFIPESRAEPASKLCAWTAIWRDMILEKRLALDSLVVVAGGDCYNALVDGQKVEMEGTDTFYFFYPFEEDISFLERQLERLASFLGGIREHEAFEIVKNIKMKVLDIDRKRVEGKVSAKKAFEVMVAASDLKGDLPGYEHAIDGINEEEQDHSLRVALLGVPPIYPDFHEVLASCDMHVVYDELPFEFARLSGSNMEKIAESYSSYTFARELEFRLGFLERELGRRKVDGVIHYTQYACHHLLEDEVMRKRLDYPWLTIQGDMPKRTTNQVKLRVEAFGEMLQKW